MPYQHLARLTAGDISIADDGVATIRSPAGEWTVGPADDVQVCGPCAVTRWLKILDLAVTHLSTRTIAGALKKTSPVDHHSPHVCHTALVLAAATMAVPLLPPIDQWGALPLPLHRLSPHSLSRRVRDLLAGDLAPTATYPSTPTRNRRRRVGEAADRHPGAQPHLRRVGRERGLGPPPP